MNDGKENLYFSFPPIPDSIASEYNINRLILRPFGESERDINIDFNHKQRPYLVTQILKNCTENEIRNGETIGIDPDFFLDLTISKRIEALLAIATSGSASGLALQLHCSYQACGEFIEVEITKDDITGEVLPENDTGKYKVSVNGSDFFFRKPIGSDQLRWLNTSFSDEDDAVETMIRDLCIFTYEKGKKKEIKPGFSPNVEWFKAVDEGMMVIDPLIHYNLSVCCPACNKETNYTIDLEDLLLRRLHKIKLNLLDTIHHIATHYHWSEQEILSLPPDRRAYYLSLIERDEKNILK